MAVLTSAHASLMYKGVLVGRVRNFSVNITRDALSTTQLGDWNQTYTNGLRGATASGTLLYDPAETQMIEMMTGIFSDSGTPDAVIVKMDTTGNKSISFNAFITSMGASVSFGEASACSIELQITGAISETL